MGNLTLADIPLGSISDSYTYASSLGSFFMRNDYYKNRHNMTEHLVVLERSDLSDSPFFLSQFGWSIDLNAAVIN